MILVSACLLGHSVRYKGDACPQALLLAPELRPYLLPFCPEVAGGLPTPRLPAEISGGSGSDVWQGAAAVINSSGREVSASFRRGARLCLRLIRQYDIRFAILKQRSPSCGTAEIYDGSFSGGKIRGAGVTAALLAQAGVTIYNEEELTPALLSELLTAEAGRTHKAQRRQRRRRSATKENVKKQ